MLLKGKIPIHYILNKIKFEIIIVFIYTLSAWFAVTYFELEHFYIPLSIPTILGTIISLLLAFKSNQAYDRWWEARIIWGSVVNDSRSFTRQVLTFVQPAGQEDEEKSDFRTRLIKRQIAWCYSLANSLRKLNPTEGLGRLISKRELQFVAKHDNVPYALINLHAKDFKLALNEGWINEFQQVELDNTLTRLCDSMGKGERIKNTVFPVTYSMYIHFSLYFFIMLLPFGVIEHIGIVTIPLVTVLASFFLLIEKMATHLQDPFENKPTDTPMSTISRTIEKNLKQMLEEDDIPEAKQESAYYVL